MALQGLKNENKDSIDKQVELFIKEARFFKSEFLKTYDTSQDEIQRNIRGHGKRISDLEICNKERPTIRTVSEMIKEYDKTVSEPRCFDTKFDITKNTESVDALKKVFEQIERKFRKGLDDLQG